ncbi:NADP-dependent oxidoreductase domain-containing protein [Kalaharituber pfeilii]|nr:NADP-dependent oxidoreductase domain-containing protein [Kalaharituber pfeilii]
MPTIHFGVWEIDEGPACSAAVQAALEEGYRAIDSAEWYENESSVGQGIRAFLSSSFNKSLPTPLTRSDIFFTTKLKDNVDYAETRKAIKKSLQKSGLGYIDLYLLHSPYGGRKTREECWRAVMDAVQEGEVKSGGVSNFGVRHLKELDEESGLPEERWPTVNQIEVHPFNTNTEIAEYCRKHNIQIQAYSPLVRGMGFSHPVIKELSTKYKCTPAQLLIRWSLQMGYVPLPKSANRERIKSNAAVDNIVIEEEDVKRLEGLDEHLVTDWDPTNCP